MTCNTTQENRNVTTITPYVPSWFYPNNAPKTCPSCGDHEGFHNDAGVCLRQALCGCTGMPTNDTEKEQTMENNSMRVEFDDARNKAKAIARHSGESRYLVRLSGLQGLSGDIAWEITTNPPLIGEWWHVYPDGLVIRRG